MEVVERLTLEAAQADTMLACEHRQRYEFAAPLCGGLRVLDLCCGSGYGSAILAEHAREVVGVDNDAATVERAQATVGREVSHASFELADAVKYLEAPPHERFDVVVCFEGLEHLHDLDRALGLLREHAEQGTKLIASVPNGKMFGEQNPFHVTEFGYREALAAFEQFPQTEMLPQFLAEGSLICPPQASGTDVKVALEGRNEPDYANHFIFFVNFDEAVVGEAHHGRVQLNTSPVFNRWSAGMKQAVAALRRENTRLARGRLGKAGSAAASALASLNDRDARIAALEERCRLGEARVKELEAGGRTDGGGDAGVTPVVHRTPPAESSAPVVMASFAGEIASCADADEDPNSWESRRLRAAEFLIPWIEQTVSLEGKTVLEYGCGNAAVSCAFAERAGRLVGLDIDAEWIEAGRHAAQERGLENVELELHPVESILDAARAHRGEVDVFLCYAVLEHLTVPERLELLRVAREVVKSEGVIVVCEAPNRLIYSDYHTSKLPFFQQLPDELALDYYRRSAREDFRAAVDAEAEKGREAALEAITRWGRGVSFHEFEVVFGDLSRHVIASNYDPILFPERAVHPDEVLLARYLGKERPDLAPVWSRFWLDLILSPQPVERRPPFLRPWTAQTLESARVGWSEFESLELADSASTLWVTLPQPTSKVVIAVMTDDQELILYARGESMAESLSAWIKPRHPPLQAFATFELPHAEQRVAIGASGRCTVVFVGYEE